MILGGGGFIGRHLAATLALRGVEVLAIGHGRGLEPACTSYSWQEMHLPSAELTDVISNWRPEVLIHAASTADVGRSIREPAHDFENSVRVWAGVLEAVRLASHDCKLIYLSSAAVYGNPTSIPVRETDAAQPVSPYGHHKHICELLARCYCEQYGLKISIIRIFSAYGPGLARQLIWDICCQVRAGQVVRLMGTGAERRDLVNVVDVVGAIELVASRGETDCEVYNLGSGHGVTIRDVAETLLDVFGTECNLVFSGVVRAGDPLHWEAEINRLSRIGYTPSIDMRSGLEEYVSWFRKLPPVPSSFPL